MEKIVKRCQAFLRPGRSWVLFANGTIVIVPSDAADPESAATAILTDAGQVVPGTPSGDFSVVQLDSRDGWVVTSHCKDVFTFVDRAELDDVSPADYEVGLHGRAKRQADADNPRVVHVERDDAAN